MPIYHPQKIQVAALIDQWLHRAHLTQIQVVQALLSQGLVVSEKTFHQWYKNPQRGPSPDPAMATGVIRVFASRSRRQECCTAAEALQFLALTRVSLECAKTIKPWFAPEDWSQAVEGEIALVRAKMGGTREVSPADRASSPRVATVPPRTVLPVRDIRLDDFLFKQGPHPVAAYFARSNFAAICAAVQEACQHRQGGIILYGPPMVGKTRAALEALQRAAGDFVCFLWPPMPIDLARLLPLRDQRVVLFLDDLHELSRRQMTGDIIVAAQTLRQLTQSLVVIATCRSGSDEESVQQEFGTLIEQLTTFHLAPMAREGVEVASFHRFLEELRQREPHRHLAVTQFDGTPGSVFLGLDRRTRQLRSDPHFPAGAKAILQALALLRAAAIYDYLEERVRRVAESVFPTQGSWMTDLDYLLHHAWLRLERSPHGAGKHLRVLTDAYLDICLPDAEVYPQPGLRVQDDLLSLVPVLADDPPDVPALFRLSRTLYFEDAGPRAAIAEGALTCAQTGLASLASDEESHLWGEGYLALGRAYWLQSRGQRADNLERALAALRSAEQAYPFARFPYEWAEVQRTLGHVLTDIESGDRAEHLEHAIACYQSASQVLTRETFPSLWARLQGNLGNAYADRLHGTKADNLELALAYYRAALAVHTRDATPVDWAREHVKIGEAYCRRVRGDREENITHAIAAYTTALEVFTTHAFPFQWAFVQYDLGDAMRQRRNEGRIQYGEEAIVHYNQALTILTAKEYPFEHALIHLSLGHVHRERTIGDPAANSEQALSCYAVAATTLTRANSPTAWATLQTGYGYTYLRRQQGDCASNLQTARSSFEAALTIHTRDNFPTEWAEAMEGLGQVYLGLAEAAQRANDDSAHCSWLATARAIWQATTEVYSEAEFPNEFARASAAPEAMAPRAAMECRRSDNTLGAPAFVQVVASDNG